MDKYILIFLMTIIPYPLLSQNSFDPLDGRYALVIGISHFADQSNNLKYAAKDAQDIYRLITEQGRFKNDNVRLLLDSNATRENVRRNIEGWLQKTVATDDIVLIYFSGHGTQGVDNNNDEEDGYDEFLVPFDYDSSDYSSLISDDDFARWIKNLKSENIVIILDCCYSGGAAKQKGFLPSNLKSINIRTENDFTDELPKEGTCLLAASKSNQLSYESDELSNGVFTYNFKNAVTDKGDMNNDEIIDEQELFFYIKNNIKDQNQSPVFLNNLKTSLNLFYLTPEVKVKDSKFENLEQQVNYLKKTTNQYRSIDDYKYLISLLEEKLKYNYDDINVIFDLANCYEYIEEYKKAYYYFDLLSSKDKKKDWSTKLAEISIKAYDCRRAVHILEKKLNENLDFSVLNILSNAYLCSGDINKAIDILYNSIKKDKYNNPKAFLSLFYIYYGKSDFENSYSIISEAFKYFFKDFEIIWWKGYFEKHYKNNVVYGDSLINYFWKITANDRRVLEASFRLDSNISYKKSNTGTDNIDQNKDIIFAKYSFLPYLHKLVLLHASKKNDIDLFNEALVKYKIYNKLNFENDQELQSLLKSME